MEPHEQKKAIARRLGQKEEGLGKLAAIDADAIFKKRKVEEPKEVSSDVR